MAKLQTFLVYTLAKKYHAAWKTIGEISGKRSKPTIRIKGGSSNKRMSNLVDHFKNLLGKAPKVSVNMNLPKQKISDPLSISTNQFTIKELKAVLKMLRPSKAFGPDNIPAIIWKDDSFHQLLLKVCNF